MDSGSLDQLVEILEPTVILSNYLQYIDQVKLLLKVGRIDPSFEEVMPDSIHHPENHSYDLLPSFLYGIGYCTSCGTIQASDTRPRCDPFGFLLPSSTESSITTLMAFGDFNTRCSRMAPFKIPRHCQRDQGSLVYVFSLMLNITY